MLTEDQIVARRGRIGASDVAAIFDLDPFRSEFDVWIEKVQDVEPAPESPAMAMGNTLERHLLDRAEDRLGPLERGVEVTSGACPVLTATLDGRVLATGEIVEAKTAGLYWRLEPGWGEPGTAEVPERVTMQVQAQLLCVPEEVQQGHVVAFLGGRGDCDYLIPRDRVIGQHIAESLPAWWTLHVVGNVAPSNSRPSLDLLRRVRRQPEGLGATIAMELIEQYEAAVEARKSAAGIEKTVKASVIAALGNCSWAPLPDGRLADYSEQTSNRLNVTRLRAELPEVAAQFTEAVSARTLRIKKGR